MVDSLPRRIHCVGAGGAGMLPLSLYLAAAGHDVSAEDDSFAPESKVSLERGGIIIGSKLDEQENVAIVYSSAIKDDHPARVFAKKTGSIAMRRGECLAVIASGKRLIAVAGSHGKTTTCAMLIDLFRKAEVSIDYVLGAQFLDAPAFCCSESEWMVAEIDESDGTIELFNPEISVILNVDHDHHAKYATSEEYFSVFKRMVERTKEHVVVQSSLIPEMGESIFKSSADVLGVGKSDAEVVFECNSNESGWTELNYSGGKGERSFTINRVGLANCTDAVFSLLSAELAGCSFRNETQLEFSGVRRRQTGLYISPAISVFEDYAHHPVEIEAAIEQFKSTRSEKLVVVFQPHRFSRTARLKSELAESLLGADQLILLDVYAASEAPMLGGTGTDLYEACVKVNIDCTFCKDESQLWKTLKKTSEGGSQCILFLGAGIGDRLARTFAEDLKSTDVRWGSVFRALGEVAGVSTRILANETLANKTTMRLGGAAEVYFEPTSLRELKAVVSTCSNFGLPVRPIGRGSNLIVPDGGVCGMVLRLNHPVFSQFRRLENGSIRVGAGLRIKVLCGQACKEELTGFEFLEGIPGNVGGVLRMNAGAMGGWVFDVVESVTYMTLDGELRCVEKSELEYGYRYCRDLESAIAIEAVFRAKGIKDSKEDIRRTIDTYQEKRKESQPREPSAGCIFKNPDGDSAGRLIDELGLKGTQIGGAEFSATHGNFIVNRGGATSRDVVDLVRFARKVALERKGVDLHPEALLFGSNWNDVIK